MLSTDKNGAVRNEEGHRRFVDDRHLGNRAVLAYFDDADEFLCSYVAEGQIVQLRTRSIPARRKECVKAEFSMHEGRDNMNIVK